MTTAKGAETLIQQMYKLRDEYRIATERIPPQLVGFHPLNRNGEPPSGERCLKLTAEIFKRGFDPNEADCNGIVIMEPKDTSVFHDFNVKACDGDDKLAAILAGSRIMYGSLSHSHLNQLLKNIAAGCPLNIPGMCRPENGGKACVDLLSKSDPNFATYCQKGLRWDILDARIMTERPDALNIIQAACNIKNSICLQTHETEALSGLSKLIHDAQQKKQELPWEGTREKMMLTMPTIAADPDFVSIFRFALELGGESAAFLPDLREFTSKFVDGQAGVEVALPGKRFLFISGME